MRTNGTLRAGSRLPTRASLLEPRPAGILLLLCGEYSSRTNTLTVGWDVATLVAVQPSTNRVAEAARKRPRSTMYSTKRANKNLVEGNKFITVGDPYKEAKTLPKRWKGKQFQTPAWWEPLVLGVVSLFCCFGHVRTVFVCRQRLFSVREVLKVVDDSINRHCTPTLVPIVRKLARGGGEYLILAPAKVLRALVMHRKKAVLMCLALKATP